MFRKGILYFVLLSISSSLKANVAKLEGYSSASNNSSYQELPSKGENQNDLLRSFEAIESASLEELYNFYTNENFSSDVYSEIKAAAMLVEVDVGITQDTLKDIFPNKCDILIDQVASAVRDYALASPILLDGARDMKKACAGWEGLSSEDRANLYVALVTSMALSESSCNNRIKNRAAKNGTAHGYWQSTRPLSPVRGANWVMGQLESQIERSGLLFWANSNLNYWAVLNPNIHAFKVKRLLKKIPACVVEAIKNAK